MTNAIARGGVQKYGGGVDGWSSIGLGMGEEACLDMIVSRGWDVQVRVPVQGIYVDELHESAVPLCIELACQGPLPLGSGVCEVGVLPRGARGVVSWCGVGGCFMGL